MLPKSVAPTRLVCLASAMSILLNLPVAGYAQQPPPPPPASPAPEQAPPKEEKPPDTAKPPEPGGEEKEAPEAEQPESKPAVATGATLKGKLAQSDRHTPLPDARVHVIARDQTVYTSVPSDAKGRYSLAGVPPGTYRLAVSNEEGVFTLESDVGISSANTYTVNLAVIHAEAARGTVPGLDLEPRGFAAMLQGKAGGAPAFWGSAKGITLLAVTAGAIALILSQSDNGGGESTPVSPSSP